MATLIEKKAEEFCVKNGHRITEPRFAVLKIIASSKKPIKAYEILSQLSKILKNPKPPTAYRAIEFWQKHNFVHRIESLNAYMACSQGHFHRGSQFLICDDCGKVVESVFSELPNSLKKNLLNSTFKPLRWNFEINGRCNQCS